MTAGEWDRAHLWRFRARCFRPIDGDTFVAIADVGFGAAALPHIRIAGFHAPERGEIGAMLATADLIDALTAQDDTWPWPLRIESKMRETVISPVKSFERYVATVWLVMPDGSMTDVRDILT